MTLISATRSVTDPFYSRQVSLRRTVVRIGHDSREKQEIYVYEAAGRAPSYLPLTNFAYVDTLTNPLHLLTTQEQYANQLILPAYFDQAKHYLSQAPLGLKLRKMSSKGTIGLKYRVDQAWKWPIQFTSTYVHSQ
eukprot:760048-Amorphochlora_amoeboformis.AAC.3